VVVGGSWPGKYLRHAVQLEDGLDGTGYYFPATVIEDLCSPVLDNGQDFL
jgi:hypothetical protein